uniref:Flavin containing amine oxidoreductase n=1 Tax=Megaviridae environmental sample TaxID=1737588 RepID=A0A5J6VLU4_9VIRU|nr:MAG: flavin containing amine oxidoreductase [Megaviridae environmental sample]
MKHYNIIIIGAGIAGLYTGYTLQKTHPSIAIIEKNNRVGGRIYTYYDKKKNIHVEGGAGRINVNHRLFNQLLNDLSLNNKRVNISSDTNYIDKQGNDLTKEKTEIMSKLYSFISSYDIEKHKKQLNNCYLNEFLHKQFGKTYAKKLEEMFEYKSLMYKLNCYECFKILKKDYYKNNKYFILKNGLSEVPEALKKLFKGKLYLNTVISDIKHSGDQYILDNKFTCDILICALPKDSLVKFTLLKPFKSLLNSINEIPLTRIYEQYDKKEHNQLLHCKKTITNNKVQFIIPINDTIIMSSYSDLKNATYWRDIQMHKSLTKELHKELSHIFNSTIPDSKWIKLFYWKNGVGSWKKKVDTQMVSEKIINLLPNFYICGENYSLYQAWCEGALITSEKVIHLIKKHNLKSSSIKHKEQPTTSKSRNTKPKIIKKTKKTKTKRIKRKKSQKYYTMDEIKKHNKRTDAWILLNKKVYNVTSWIDKHPGGDIILKWIGRDGTKQFNNIHPAYVKEKILPKYLIGKLKNKTKKNR